jgi:dihydrofolate reductase
MSRVVVINHITLDGVVQGPGRPEEDPRDGFTQGGWASAHADDAAQRAVYERVAAGGGLRLLLGRVSYEGMLGYWNTQGGPFKDGLNNARKYVASRTLSEPLPWPNSTLLRGDVVEAVQALKAEPGPDLTVMGSGELIQTLMRHQLIDEYLLLIHPLVLGEGRRLFVEGGPSASVDLVESTRTGSGVLVVTYRRSP